MHVKITLKDINKRGQLLNLKFFKYNNQRKKGEKNYPNIKQKSNNSSK
jgi:hypothetical protein